VRHPPTQDEPHPHTTPEHPQTRQPDDASSRPPTRAGSPPSVSTGHCWTIRACRSSDHPQALLSCNHDPLKALCEPNRGTSGRQLQRTPSQDRCHNACANISRTDTHLERIQAEVDRIDAEITDGLVPLPIQQRLRQRQTTLNEIITRHQATRIYPNSPEDPQ
jgi:hypothetical protein